MIRTMLVGNPNCGKTTLFNELTGEHQRVGNWPGVTVEQKSGTCLFDDHAIHVIDLPGVYSLTALAGCSSLDEQISARAVLNEAVDVVINVIDACQLERHLYLTSQLLELGCPVVIALNMMDIAQQRGIVIDSHALEARIGCPVIEMQAHQQVGIEALKQAIVYRCNVPRPMSLHLSPAMIQAQQALVQALQQEDVYPASQAFYCSQRILEGDNAIASGAASAMALPDEADMLIADARYQAVHEIVLAVQHKRADASEHFTAKLDRIVLHRFWALPIFLLVMYVMFLFAINIGGAFQDFFDISSEAIFVQGSASLLEILHAPRWVIAMLANGVGKGVNTTLTFIPVIAAMFFFLSLLESSGYMARAAFVVDRVMRALGLPGKSFVPMIVGFGCNVPAILASRTLDSEQDRLLTVLMSPFMSCSARLAIYAIFVAAFFPVGGHNVVFSLYLIGILAAVLTGFILRKMVFFGKASPLLLELPAYHKPSWHRLFKETHFRLRHFIIRAGKLIIPVCMVLGGLNGLTLDGGLVASAPHSPSILAVIGQWITPLFAPMGIQADNWPATMGLLTGMLAKEVVVGTLHTLYAQIGDVAQTTVSGGDVWSMLQAACWSVPENLAALGQLIRHPFEAVVSSNALPNGVSAILLRAFDGPVGAYAYLLFVLLYIPCVSTMAVIRQEAGYRWMWFSMTWSLLLAYTASVGFYQIATLMSHPIQSLGWCLAMGGVLSLALFVVRWFAGVTKQEPYVIATT